MKLKFKKAWNILKAGFGEFGEMNVPKKAAALAYYTVFALTPMLIVIITIVQFFYGEAAIQGDIYPQIKGLVGSDAAAQIEQMIANAAVSDKSTLSTIISIVMLVVLATGVFVEIQDSINHIWHLKAKNESGFLKLLLNRLLSFSLVVSLGFILLVSLMINAGVEAIMDRLSEMLPDLTFYVGYILNLVITFVVITLLFATIFKVLPDANIKWKQVMTGAVITALLFMVGKFGITIYLSNSDVASTYGAAGSMIIILLWVYYSAIILYFGAILTRVYLQAAGHTIHPNKYAVFVREVQVENKGSLSNQASTSHIQNQVNEENDSTKRVGF